MGTLLLTVVFSAALTFYCAEKAGMLEDTAMYQVGDYMVLNSADEAAAEQQEENKDSYTVLAYIMLVTTVMLLFGCCFLMKSVRICIEVIRSASGAVRAIPVLMIWPIVPFISIVLLFMYFCLIAAFVGSAGDLSSSDITAAAADVGIDTTSDAYLEYTEEFANRTGVSTSSASDFSSDELMQYMLFYHFFGLLWTNALINAISLTTVAGAVCRYYYSGIHSADPAAIQKAGAAQPLGRTPVWNSLYTTLRYHLGSMITGALIIAIVQMIRFCLEYIDRKTKDLQEKNFLIKVIMKVVKCCMWCMEKCLKFISRNAYIVIAMRGDSFCWSTMHAFKLIWDNVKTVGVVNFVTTIVLFLARVMITAACGFFMFTVLDDPQFEPGGDRELSTPFFPVLIVLLLAYAVSTAFMNVFDLAIDTILLCFCEDVSRNKNGGIMFASKSLQKVVGHVPPEVKKTDDGDGGGDEVQAKEEAAVEKAAVTEITPTAEAST